MARPPAQISANMGGGIRLDKSPLELADNESPDLRNFRPIGVGGAIGRRQLDATPTSSIAATLTPTAANSQVVTIMGEDFDLLFHASDGVITDNAGNSEGTGFGSSKIHAWAVGPTSGGQGPLYFIDTTLGHRYYDGTNLGTWTASAGSLPSSAGATMALVSAGNRIFAFTGDSFTFSELGDPRNWPAANTVTLPEGDGGFQGAGLVGGYIVAFKQNNAWVIYDLDTGANRPMSEDVGLALNAGGSIVTTPYGLVFLDPDRGVCMTDGSTVKAIGRAVFPLMEDALQAGAFLSCSGAYYRDSYLLLCGPGHASYRGLMFEYHFPTETWWIHTTDASQMGIIENFSFGVSRLVAGRLANASFDARTQYLLDDNELGNATLDNLSTLYWRSRWHDWGDPMRRKRMRKVSVLGVGVAKASLYINYEDDTAHATASADTAFPGAAGEPGELELLTPGLGRAFQLKVEQESPATAEDLELHAYAMYPKARAR